MVVIYGISVLEPAQVKGVMHIMQWKFKSCPRCDGDMFIESDLYGWYQQCLQCGHVHSLRSTVELVPQARSEREQERLVTTLSKGGAVSDE